MTEKIDDWLEAQRINGGSHGFECIGIARMQQVWDAAREDLRQQLAEIVEQNNELASRVPELRLDRDQLRQQVTLLRDAMEAAWQDGYAFCGAEGLSDAQKQFQSAFSATEPKQQEYRGPYVAKEQGK